MNIVTIDPSLSCTAVVANDKKFVYSYSEISRNKDGSLKKWFEMCSPLVTVRDFSRPSKGSYSDTEIEKLKTTRTIVSAILNDISESIDQSLDTLVAIEGYSYSSSAGPLIDLVCFGSILRNAFLSNGFDNVIILSPSEVKVNSASLTYEPIKNSKGKILKYVNNDGVSAGSFKKTEMFKTLIENKKLCNDKWVKFLDDNKDNILAVKDIPKPIEDINDAKLLYEYLKQCHCQ